MTAHSGTTFGNAVIIVIAEYIQFGLVITKQRFCGYDFKTGSHTAACAVIALSKHIDVTHSAGANEKAVRIVFLQPCAKESMITGMIGRCVPLRQAGYRSHIRFIGKLSRADGNPVFLRGAEQQIRLLKGHRLVGSVDARAVGDGHH